MLRLAFSLFMGGVSAACGLAAVGLTLYAQSPSAMAAAQLFGTVGFIVGLVCGGLHQALRGQPALSPVALPPEALAGLVRATLAHAAAARTERAGSAADRRPEPVGPARAAPTAEPAAAPVAAAAAAAAAPARQLASSAFGA
jgi:hypothetical protein